MLHPHMKSMNTFTDVFDFVAFRLMNAGWLRMYSIGSKEYAMEWSNKGSGRAALIRPIVAEFGLGGGADVVSRFTRECQNGLESKEQGFRDSSRMFWLACLEELSLEFEEESWWTLVRIVQAGYGKSSVNSLPVGLAILRLDDTIHPHAGLGAQNS